MKTKKTLPLVIGTVTVILIAVGTLFPGEMAPISGVAGGVGAGTISSPDSPEGATQALLQKIQRRDFAGAYSSLANASELDLADFTRGLTGIYDSLLTTAALQPSEIRVLNKSADTALVRVDMNWATAVGPFHETRDLKVAKQASQWKIVWPASKEPRVPPQVIPVNYLRWDVIFRGPGDDWGTQEVESPHVRIIAMNATSRADSVVILGEILNEDTVPAFVSVKASLVGKDGNTSAQESSFDKMMHVLLPKEISPFRIDFPGVKLSDVKSVRMQPASSLVPASADPVIEIAQQRLDTDARGRRVLRGALVNQSGQVVNIPHVIAAFYSRTGQIVWVSDGYVDQALLPQTPSAFAVDIPDDLVASIQNYRVVVNEYSTKRP